MPVANSHQISVFLAPVRNLRLFIRSVGKLGLEKCQICEETIAEREIAWSGGKQRRGIYLAQSKGGSVKIVLNYPAASCGVSNRSKQDLSVIVGWVEARSADTYRWGIMGIAESILNYAEGLNPSYVGIATERAAGDRTRSD